MGLRSLVYGACALVVLLCLLFMVLVLLHVNHGAAQQHSYVPNRGVPQYYSPVLPHCPSLCLMGGHEGTWTI